MLSKVFIAALVASPLVAAHGKIAVMTGDAGGNTTALGIQGGVVPGPGKNAVTEVDTTVFKSRNVASDGLGKTSAGPNTMAGMSAVVAQSGNTLAQVTPGGTLSGTLHIVTTDGAGPYRAMIDSTGTGAFSTGTEAEVTTQVPGRQGNIRPPQQRSLYARALVKMGIMKRAQNVNEDYPIAVTIPAGTTCTGTVGGQKNVCLVKLANPSGAGPFGGVVAIQMASSGNSTTAATSSTGSTTAATSSTDSSSADADSSSADADSTDSADDDSTDSAGDDSTDSAAAGNDNTNAAQGNQNTNAGNDNTNAGNDNTNAAQGNQNAQGVNAAADPFKKAKPFFA